MSVSSTISGIVIDIIVVSNLCVLIVDLLPNVSYSRNGKRGELRRSQKKMEIVVRTLQRRKPQYVGQSTINIRDFR